jgi:septum formation protein
MAKSVLSTPMPLILASASPRRRELLASTAMAFQVIPAAVDERPEPNESAEVYVRRLALAKAQAVARRHAGVVVVGADTIVTIDGLLLGKPSTIEAARSMLQRLSGRMHEVVTGVAVFSVATAAGSTPPYAGDVITSRVFMHRLTARTIEWYLATGEPMDKAGAYAIQGLGAALIERVEGSYTNVVGLPLTQTLALLRHYGMTADA